MTSNRQVVLAERPRYLVPTANCFRMGKADVPQVGEGQVLLQTQWLAMESTLYARVQRVTTLQRDPIELGQAMRGSAVGRVVDSKHPRFKVGNLASGQWGWQEYDAVDGARLRNLDFGPQKPSYALGAYGLAGFGAFIAVDTLAPPSPGQTVVTGTATHRAASRLRADLIETAAGLLQTPAAALELADGMVRAGPDGPSAPLGEVAAALAAERDTERAVAEATFEVDHMTYPYGIHVAVVRVVAVRHALDERREARLAKVDVLDNVRHALEEHHAPPSQSQSQYRC